MTHEKITFFENSLLINSYYSFLSYVSFFFAIRLRIVGVLGNVHERFGELIRATSTTMLLRNDNRTKYPPKHRQR